MAVARDLNVAPFFATDLASQQFQLKKDKYQSQILDELAEEGTKHPKQKKVQNVEVFDLSDTADTHFSVEVVNNAARSQDIQEIISLSDDLCTPTGQCKSNTAVLDLCASINSPSNKCDDTGAIEIDQIIDLCHTNDSEPSELTQETYINADNQTHTQRYVKIPSENLDPININPCLLESYGKDITINESDMQPRCTANIMTENVADITEPSHVEHDKLQTTTQPSTKSIILDNIPQETDYLKKDSITKHVGNWSLNIEPQNNSVISECIENQVKEFSGNLGTQFIACDDASISLKRPLDDHHQPEDCMSLDQFYQDSSTEGVKRSRILTEMEDPDVFVNKTQSLSRASDYTESRPSYMKHIKLYSYYPIKTRKPIFPTKIKHLEDGSVRRFLGHQLNYHIKTLIATQGRKTRPDTKEMATNTSLNESSDQNQPPKTTMQNVNHSFVSQRPDLQKDLTSKQSYAKETPQDPLPGTSRISNLPKEIRINKDPPKTILPIYSVPFGIPIAFQRLYAKLIKQDCHLATVPKLESQQNPDGSYHYWWSFPSAPCPFPHSPCAGIQSNNLANTENLTNEPPDVFMPREYQNVGRNYRPPPPPPNFKFTQPSFGQRISTSDYSADSESSDSDSDPQGRENVKMSALVHRSQDRLQISNIERRSPQRHLAIGPERVRRLHQQQLNNERPFHRQSLSGLQQVIERVNKEFGVMINERQPTNTERPPVNIISQYVLPVRNTGGVEQQQDNVNNRRSINDDRNMIIEGRRPNIVQRLANINQQAVHFDRERHDIQIPINEEEQVDIQQPPANIDAPANNRRYLFDIAQQPMNVIPQNIIERQQPNVGQQGANIIPPHMVERHQQNVEQQPENQVLANIIERFQPNLEQHRENVPLPQNIERRQPNLENQQENIDVPQIMHGRQLNLEQQPGNIAQPPIEQQQLVAEPQPANAMLPDMAERRQPNVEEQHVNVIPRQPRIPERPIEEQRRIERVVERVPLDRDFQILPIDPRPMIIQRRQANNALNPLNNNPRPLMILRRPVNIGFRLINVAHRPMEIEQVVNFEERVINVNPNEQMDEEERPVNVPGRPLDRNQAQQEIPPEREIEDRPNSPQNQENAPRRQLHSPPVQNGANDRPGPAISPPARFHGLPPVMAHIRLQPLGSPPRRANNQNANVRPALSPPQRGSPDWVAINRAWPLPSPDSTV